MSAELQMGLFSDQTGIDFNNGENQTTLYPYTFEDALVIENREKFKAITPGKGLLKKMVDAYPPDQLQI